METKKKALARNQSLFREMNERVEQLGGNELFLSSNETFGFFCECSDEECTEAVWLTVEEYEFVRAHPARFAILPGHEIDEIERVVLRQDRYAVVEKEGEFAVIVAEAYPRERAAAG